MFLFLFSLCFLVTCSLAFYCYNFSPTNSKFEYTLSYCIVSRTVNLDYKYTICKFNKGSCNHLFFEYLFQHKGRDISKTELIRHFGEDFMRDRSYSHFLSTNFYKDVRAAFFFISGDSIRVTTEVALDKQLKLF